jgi:YD repeat-containing protein
MKKLLFLLSITICLNGRSFDNIVPSTPDEIASLNSDLIVEGYVSALSGQLVISETDLHVRGAQDLFFKRIYVPPQIQGRYHDKDKRDKYALGEALLQLYTKGWITLPNLWAGYNFNSPYFQIRDSQGTVLEFEIQGNRGVLKTSSYGCSNLKLSKPDSKADIRNIKFIVEGNQVKVTWPDGTQRIYVHQIAGLFRLKVEYLPNGKAIRYQWNRKGLVRISATDAKGKYLYAYLDRIGNQHFRASDGREVELLYETKEIKGSIKKKKYKEKAVFHFPVMTKAKNPVYPNHVGYNERTLLNSYDALDYPISCSYIQKKETLARIKTFSTPFSSFSFSYDPPVAGQKGGFTTVSYPDGVVVIYRFNSSLLLTSLENWFEGKLYNQKLFSYDHKQHIKKVETKDSDGYTLVLKSYECDRYGNPILETITSDIGTFSIRRSFSKNRLITEERDDGLAYRYSYLEETHLPLSKTTLMYGKPIRKVSYVYDDANNLVQKKEEGKTIVTYHLFQKGAHLHRVHVKEIMDWSGNLIHKTKYTYDQFGNVSREDHYGSDDRLAYTTTNTYDAKGNLLEETNSLGQTAIYTYDRRNRPVKEIPFSHCLTIERIFDSKGRLTNLKEGDHKTSFQYNASDELIEKTDYLGLTTRYTYHPVYGKPVRIEASPILQENSYDAFGRATKRIDVYGDTIQTKFNSFGDPLEIIYPSGGKKTFDYSSNGRLIEITDPDGIKTSYSYDPLGRILFKKQGASETNYIYDAYHLIEERDPLGISTYYTYNSAGQKIKEEKAGRATEFAYDALGFLSLKKKSQREISYKNDVFGRVLNKNIDGVLKTSFTYDPSGNLASISNGDPIYFSYDPYGRLTFLKKMDKNLLAFKRYKDHFWR